jgi:mono/diheme cytochrome c family protein
MAVKLRGFILLMVLGLVIMIGLSTLQSDSDTELNPVQVAEGRQVYVQYCAACHGSNGEGQVPSDPLVPDATGKIPAPPHNSTGHTWHHDDDLLKRIVHDGGLGDERFYEMPAFGEILTDKQIDAVITYIKTLWTEEQRERQRERTEAIRNAE